MITDAEAIMLYIESMGMDFTPPRKITDREKIELLATMTRGHEAGMPDKPTYVHLWGRRFSFTGAGDILKVQRVVGTKGKGIRYITLGDAVNSLREEVRKQK